MSGILSTGISGLSAAQYGLDTTGHNIANVNTEGYSRQRVETEASVGNAFRSTFLGNGTQLSAITRTFNEYNFKEVMFNSSQYQYNNANYVNASRLDNLLADPDTGITVTFEDMFDGVNGIVEEPTIISARNVLISRAETVAQRFNNLYEEMFSQHLGAINDEMTTTVEEINAITSEIAFLNTEIQVENAVADGGFPANDLLDTRERLLKELSQKVQVTTIDYPDGTINVTIGQGLTLVTGGVSVSMTVDRNIFDSSKLEIAMKATPGSTESVIVTDSLAGGSMTGLIDARDNVLYPALRDLGKLAIGIADNFNRQQTLGRDLNGDAGTNLFKDINDPQLVLDRTLGSSENALTSYFEVYIRNSQDITGENYEMEYDGTNLDVYDEDGELIQQFTAADITNMAAGDALVVGDSGIALSINLNQMTAGDKFLIRPTFSAASQIERVLDDPKLIAAADNPLQITENVNVNNVDLTLYEITASSATAPGPLPDDSVTITVDATGTTYEIFDSAGISISGPNAIPDDQLIEDAVLGVNFKLEGTLAGNESFTITHADNPGINEDKKFGPGDNTNIVTMLSFQSQRTLDGGTNSFSESYADLVTTIGVETKTREISKSSYETLLQSAEERLAGIQGVNLDEEAANLIQYQQAYSASARIITVAREIFQTLMNAAG